MLDESSDPPNSGDFEHPEHQPASSPDPVAREEVLRRVREALGERRTKVRVDIPRGYRAEGSLLNGELQGLFIERVEDYKATVTRCGPSDEAVAEAVRTTLEELSARVVVAPEEACARWLGAPGPDRRVTVDDGSLTSEDLDTVDAVVTGSAVGIAETGTIVLDGSGASGRRILSLVPDVHVCVVRAADVVQTVPEALVELDPERPLTFISGPSATSDIELSRVEGVHGPRTLRVILAG
ncbi:MAG TPA: LUD domain-containing protein [Segeticoccus sp.]|uniref:LutC/YkgG family protein n=1 Tax=Segeticoccus sp. TaxID=2706531 RepID=UPI002D80DFA2|nr:LUD domain-containing protein [Segeticoccus sp.]HET8599037.1 LUD domain-containing protein [Segeticoccus sp.]